VLSEILDCLMMVLGWIGFDNFYDYYFDSYLSPDISYYSLLLTFSISHSVYFLIAFSQYTVHKLMSGRVFIIRIAVEHFINIIMFISSILLWKFYWDLGDFFLRDVSANTQLIVLLTMNAVVFLIAIMLRLTWCLVGPGVITFDGDSDDKDAYFDICYFSKFLEVISFFIQIRIIRSKDFV